MVDDVLARLRCFVDSTLDLCSDVVCRLFHVFIVVVVLLIFVVPVTSIVVRCMQGKNPDDNQRLNVNTKTQTHEGIGSVVSLLGLDKKLNLGSILSQEQLPHVFDTSPFNRTWYVMGRSGV